MSENDKPVEIDETDMENVAGGTNTTTPSTNAGSQSTGAGAGKVTFNPFSIPKVVDKPSA